MKKTGTAILIFSILLGCNLSKSKHTIKKTSQFNAAYESLLNEYLETDKLKDKEGLYNIDSTKSNLHTYKDFKFILKEIENGINLYYMESEKYGYSHTWTKGELFGTIDSIKDKTNQIYFGRINEHRGEIRKEMTPHEIQILSLIHI